MNLYALFFGLALFGFCSCDNDDSVTPDPQARQAFESKYPNATQVEWEKKYEVVFVNGEKAEFLKDGSWEKVDCKYSTVSTGIVPQAIKDYVSKHYPEAKILKIERDSKTYEVKLNNQLELEFNKAFQLIDIDN